ncbi:DUF397 domain-containing protein [Streptomyces sp. NPDC050264]
MTSKDPGRRHLTVTDTAWAGFVGYAARES